jgi:hypothetical protein
MLPNLSSAGPQQQPNPLALYLLALAWALGVAFGLALPDVRLVVRRLLLSSRPLRLDSIELRKDLSGVVLLDDWPPAAAGGSVGGGALPAAEHHPAAAWMQPLVGQAPPHPHSPQPTAHSLPAAARRPGSGQAVAGRAASGAALAPKPSLPPCPSLPTAGEEDEYAAQVSLAAQPAAAGCMYGRSGRCVRACRWPTE